MLTVSSVEGRSAELSARPLLGYKISLGVYESIGPLWVVQDFFYLQRVFAELGQNFAVARYKFLRFGSNRNLALFYPWPDIFEICVIS